MIMSIKMRKWILYMLTAAIMLSCCSCNKNKDDDVSSGDKAGASSSEDMSSDGSSDGESSDLQDTSEDDGSSSKAGTVSNTSSKNNNKGNKDIRPDVPDGPINSDPPLPENPEEGGVDLSGLKASSVMSDLVTADKKLFGETQVINCASSVWEDAQNYASLRMTGVGSGAAFVVSDVTAGKALTLEIEEVHQRTDEVISYSVYVNDHEVYFRSYAPSSDGINHYFISVDGSLIKKDKLANVIIRNHAGTTMRIARVWAFSDMDKMMKTENVSRKMGVALLTPTITNNLSADKITINRLLNQFGENDMYTVAFGIEISYIASTKAALHNQIDYLMSLSAETGATFHLGLNSWWAATPSGMDGQGGLWSDINYHQVVYDPLNIDGRGNWKLSTPNIWSDVPWLTMNNATYNNARNERLKDVTDYIQKKLAEYRAAGGKQPDIGVYMENEPVYWPYYAFNASPEAAGDFNSSVIAAAKADGVTLNPEDGLSTIERVWLYKNLKKYIDEEGTAVASGYQYDAVIVKNGKVTLPSSQQIENAYTHMFTDATYPILDSRYAIWETHSINSLRFGGEWAANLTDSRSLDYIAARGKFSNVNAERSSMSNYSLLPQAYAYGADHVTIYNFKTTDTSYYKAQAGKTAEEFVPSEYNREVMSYDFTKADSISTNSVLVESVDIVRSAIGEKYYATPNNNFAKGGTLTFKIDNKGKNFTNGLVIELEGRLFTSLAASMRITVSAGSSLDSLEELDPINSLDPNTVDVTDYIDTSKSVAYVRVHLNAVRGSFYDWCSISSFKAYEKWDKETGSADGLLFTNEQMRSRNLFMGYRTDVERLLNNYADRGGKDSNYQAALELYKNYKYVSAYNLLIKNISETLPARYYVSGNGTLGKYPVSVNLGSTASAATVVLSKVSSENYIFTIQSYTALTAGMTFDVTNGKSYVISSLGDGKYELKTGSGAGSATASGGKVTFSIAVAATSKALTLPSSFEARAYSAGSTSSIKIQTQDPKISEFAGETTLNVSNTCEVWIGTDGDESSLVKSRANAILPGDYLKIKADSNNKVIEIKAYRGKMSGVVTAVKQITLKGTTSNATVTIRNSAGKTETFEIGGECKLAFTGRTGDSPKLTTIGNIGIQVGQTLTIDYCPWVYNSRNKRAFNIS